jgi:DNA-binding MarR family transcriptional regulator
MATTASLDIDVSVAELAGRLRIAAGRLARDSVEQTRLDGMTPIRLAALAVLQSDGPLRIGALAERVGISAPTTSRLVDLLEERGHIVRTTDPEDHRCIRVSLSPQGEAGLTAVRELRTGRLAERIMQLDPAALAALAAAMPVLEELVDARA